MSKKIDFEASLQDDDYGVSIGRNGDLKGLFVPDTCEELETVPEAIVTILGKIYGVDLSESEATLH